MKNPYTNSDIQKMLVDLAELVPEIDPNDSEWGAFLREFIAARPEVQLNEQFAQELRVCVLERAHQLQTKKRDVLPRWLQLSGMFVTGVAICAAILVPVFNVPKECQTHDKRALRSLKMVSNNTCSVQPKMACDLADMPVEVLTLRDAEEIPKFVIAPMMAQKMPEPIMLQAVEDGELMAGAGMLNSKIGDGEVIMDRPPESLLWSEVPSDREIIAVAIEFFDQRGFDTRDFQEPYVQKWWEHEHGDGVLPVFVPPILGVVFKGKDSSQVNIDIDLKTMRVVWMTYRQR